MYPEPMAHGFHGDAWGLAPGQRNWKPPNQLPPPDPHTITTTDATIPLWADLTYPDGTTRTEKAFAEAWTNDAVRIQWVENSLGRYAWIAAADVRRRELEGR